MLRALQRSKRIDSVESDAGSGNRLDDLEQRERIEPVVVFYGNLHARRQLI
jgi:hypothetical protein